MPGERATRQQQPDRQRLAHAEPADELRVRLAEELDDEAKRAVARQEDRADQAGTLMQAEDAQAYLQNDEQQHAFEREFVELARMARLAVASARERHRPRHVGGFSPQLAID